MNGYYTGREQYNVARYQANRETTGLDRFLDFVYALLAFVAAALRDRTVRCVLRFSVVAACFVCFMGLVGGLERGLISIGGAIFAGLALIFVEILCLRR